MSLPIELWQEVSEYLLVSDFLRLRLVSMAIANYIYPLYLVRPMRLVPNLVRNLRKLDLSDTSTVLDDYYQGLFFRLEELNANNAPNITWIPPTVKRLQCSGTSGVTQKVLEQAPPNLTHLNFDSNPKIRDLTSLTKLITVTAGPSLTQKGIRGLNLEEFYCNDNASITDVSHMDLKILHIDGECRVNQASINRLPNLIELSCNYNETIFDVSMCPLQRLYADATNISKVPTSLVELHCRYTCYLRDLSHTNLRKLEADHSRISKVPSTLIQLNARGCLELTDVSHCSLRLLDASKSGITQQGIRGLQLLSLIADDNKHIYDVSWMNLKYVSAKRYSVLSPQGIRGDPIIDYASNERFVNHPNYFSVRSSSNMV